MRAGKWQLEPQALRCPESCGWAATTTAVIGNSAWWDDSSLACVGVSGALIVTHFPLVAGQASSYAPGTMHSISQATCGEKEDFELI